MRNFNFNIQLCIGTAAFGVYFRKCIVAHQHNLRNENAPGSNASERSTGIQKFTLERANALRTRNRSGNIPVLSQRNESRRPDKVNNDRFKKY